MKENELYIQLFSLHGLVRFENPEMGRDADTGGQIKYVIELANALSGCDQVRRVDLFTRLISDKSVSKDYAVPVDVINDKFRIVRIQCGGKKYLRKELLWPYLDEYVDKTIKFIKRQNEIPDIVHGHYADAGYAAMLLSRNLEIPFVFTGHSLGRAKLQKLLGEGLKEQDIIKKYKIDRRIHVEENILQTSDLIIASTNQEVREQYGMYENKDNAKYRIIPPGLDISKFYPYYHDLLPEFEKNEEETYAQAAVLQEMNRFLMYPEKPLILSLCRPDKRKNISGLIEAYGENPELQSMANLAIFAGIRKDITDKEENEREVLTEILLLMDKYDLYGKIAIPKKHNFEYEVPALYRIAAEKRGVFVNSALTEPFGLTLIEAAATGLPIVAPNDGGPKDIVTNCDCGILVDTTHSEEISSAIKQIITDNDRWNRYSKNGIMNTKKFYTWSAHVNTYLNDMDKLADSAMKKEVKTPLPVNPVGKRLATLRYFLITDIDNTLTGGPTDELNELMRILRHNYNEIGFGVATGRTVASATAHLKKHNIPSPDIIISSVGSEIYYGETLFYDKGWKTHISNKWNREKTKRILDTLNFLEYQADEDTQRDFKISYDMAPGKDRLATIHDLLLRYKCSYNLIYSHEQFLDILPYRASKGKAIRYLSYKWEVPLKNILVCGDSGNDEEMLRGEPLAVVVSNYSMELEKLRGMRNIYFAKRQNAGGIIEALGKYKFIERSKSNI